MKTNSLLCTKYILSLLNEDSNLSSILSDRIYPLDATLGTEFPFAVVSRDTIQVNEQTKDYEVDDIVSASIIIVSNTYIQAVELVNEIRNHLEHKQIQDDTVFISDITISGADEAFYNNAYIETLHINVVFESV